jgi:hypothetical protein
MSQTVPLLAKFEENVHGRKAEPLLPSPSAVVGHETAKNGPGVVLFRDKHVINPVEVSVVQSPP